MRPPRRNPRAATLRRRYTIGGVLLLAILVGLGLNLGLILDPDEIRRRARTALEGLFAGTVTIESAEVELPNIVVLRGVSISRPGVPDIPVLTFETVHVGFSLLGALSGQTGPRRLVFDGASLMVERRADGSLDVSDLLRPIEVDDEGERPPEVRLRRGRILYRDDALLRKGGWLTLDDVELSGRSDGTILGHGRLEGLGRLAIRYEDAGAHVRVRLEGLRLEGPFDRDFKEEVGRILARVEAAGPAVIEATADRGSDGEFVSSLRLQLLGVRLAPPMIPAATDGPRMLLEDVRGDVVLTDEGRLVIEDVTARSTDGRFLLRGEIENPLNDARLDLRLLGRAVILGDTARRVGLPDDRDVMAAYGPWFLGDLDVRITTRTGPETHLALEGHLDLSAGRMQYEGWPEGENGRRLGFPYLLEDLKGRLRFTNDHVFIEGARATHGSTRIQAAGTIHLVTFSDCDVDVSIVARDLAVDEDLRTALGDQALYVLDPYEVAGRADRTHVHIIQDARDPTGAKTLVTVDLAGGLSVRPQDFPLPVTGMTGRVDVRPDPEPGTVHDRVTLESLRGDGPDGARVCLSGWIRAWGTPEEEQKLRIEIEDVRMGENLDRILASSRLAEEIRDTWRLLETRGDLDAEIEIDEGPDGSRHRLRFDVRGANIAGFPGLHYALGDLTGVIRIVDGAFDLTGAAGSAGHGRIRGSGTIDAEGSTRFDVDVRDLPADAALRRLLRDLAPDVEEAWARLAPGAGSRLDLDLTARLPASGEEAVSIRIRNPRLVLEPENGPSIEVTGGTAVADLAHGFVRCDEVRGRVNGSVFVIDGESDESLGTVTLRITTDPLRPERDLGGLLSDGLVSAIEGFLSGGRVALDPLMVHLEGSTIRLDGSQLVLFRPEGEMRGLAPRGGLRIAHLLVRPDEGVTIFRGCFEPEDLDLEVGVPLTGLRGRVSFAGDADTETVVVGQAEGLTGRLWGRALSDGKAGFRLEDDTLRIDDLTGTLDGGSLDGTITARLAPPDALRVALRLGGVKLDRFLTPADGSPGPDVAGRLDARLTLRKDEGGLERLRGEGEVVIRDGELWEIPVFSAIFGALTAVPPIEYRPVFHSADVKFDLRGDILRIRKMEFRSDLLTLERGRGKISIFGDVDLTLVPKVQTIDIPGLSDLWSLIKGELVYRIRVKGTLRRPTALLEPLPFLHEGPSTAPRVVPEFLGEIREKKGLGL